MKFPPKRVRLYQASDGSTSPSQLLIHDLRFYGLPK